MAKQIGELDSVDTVNRDDSVVLYSNGDAVVTEASDVLNSFINMPISTLDTPSKTIAGAINDLQAIRMSLTYGQGGGGDIDWDKLASLLVLDDGVEIEFLTTSDEDVNMIVNKVIEKLPNAESESF